MSFLHERIRERRELLPVMRNAPAFVPAGQSTQLIVGATRDSDLRILRLSETLYRKFALKRVYYSAYMPINRAPGQLPAITSEPPLLREHRMYQADWLLRFYGFEAGELLDESHDTFDARIDPKADWAVRHLDRFPVEINRASYEMLLRIPGVGVQSARRILAARRFGPLSFADLAHMRIVMKRAKHFITCGGKFEGVKGYGTESLTRILAEPGKAADPRFEQLSLFGNGFGGGRSRVDRADGLPDGWDMISGGSGGLAGLPAENTPFFPEPRLLPAAGGARP